MKLASDTRSYRNPFAADESPTKEDKTTEPLPPDTESSDFTGEHRKAPYTTYRTETHFRWKSGLAYGGLADASESTKDDSIAVRLSRPTTIRVINVQAERLGKPPEMLNPKLDFIDSSGSLNTLLNSKIRTQGNPETSDKTQIYRFQQRLWYLVSSNPDPAKTDFRVPTEPWRTGQTSERPPAIYTIPIE
jgi:hypothetical protein